MRNLSTLDVSVIFIYSSCTQIHNTSLSIWYSLWYTECFIHHRKIEDVFQSLFSKLRFSRRLVQRINWSVFQCFIYDYNEQIMNFSHVAVLMFFSVRHNHGCKANSNDINNPCATTSINENKNWRVHSACVLRIVLHSNILS